MLPKPAEKGTEIGRGYAVAYRKFLIDVLNTQLIQEFGCLLRPFGRDYHIHLPV